MDIEKLEKACKKAATSAIEAEYAARATDPVFAQWGDFTAGDHYDVYTHLDNVDDDDAVEEWISKNYPEIFDEILDDIEGNVYYDATPSREVIRLVQAGVL